MNKPAVLIGLVAFAALLAESGDARACGVSGVGGQAGIACSLDLPEENRVSAAYTFTSTTLTFSGDRRADVERHAVSASVSIPFGKKWVFEGGIGVLPTGSLSMNGVDYTFNPAFLAALSATYKILPEGHYAPFVLASATIAALLGSTSSALAPTEDFDAFDLRLGAAAGKHLTDNWSLYALGRVFGGPVYWRAEGESITGTDLYHYQLGIGTAYAVGPAHVFAEGVPLGERAVSVGFGSVF